MKVIVWNEMSETERRIIGQVARYRLTVPAAVAKRLLSSPDHIDHASGLLRRLENHGLLGCSPLYGQKPCHWLTAFGADQFVESLGQSTKPIDNIARPDFGPPAELCKIRAFATLAFCCLGSTHRESLTRDEFAKSWPSLSRPGLPSSFYRDPSQPNRLGFARVDLNGMGKWDRIVQTIARDGMKFLKQPGFRSLIRDERFELALITATSRKAQRIQEAWEDLTHLRAISLRVVVIPELIQLVGMPTHRPTWQQRQSRNVGGPRSPSKIPQHSNP